MSMKTKIISFPLIFLTVILFGSLANSCMPTTSTFKATLTGASETPPDSSPAKGVANFKHDPKTNILSGTITFSGFGTPSTAMHIHQGAAGVSGPVIFPIETKGGFTSPISYTSPALTTAQVDTLKAGDYYVNIHTQAFPEGEIRGQLVLQDKY